MRRFRLFVALSAVTLVLHAQSSLLEPFESCGIKGSITIYDYNKKQWITSDINDSHRATLPASTFKIVNTLIALETGVIEDENEIIPWIDDYDTSKYGHRPNIYRDLSVKQAFELSAGWAYRELAKRIGKEKYKEILTVIGYGNVDLSIDDPDFWNFGDFAVSPANQVQVLIGIYEENLPFSKRAYQVLKKIMIEEQTAEYTIRSKTGWTRAEGKDTGWWVGYIEKAGNTYFFATRLVKDRKEKNPNFGPCRKEITKTVFQFLGIL
jgi:beta-lactamase class D